jgi:hypothetical protein
MKHFDLRKNQKNTKSAMKFNSSIEVADWLINEKRVLEYAESQIKNSNWIAPGGSSNPGEASPHKYLAVFDFGKYYDDVVDRYGRLEPIARWINADSSLPGEFYFGIIDGSCKLMYAEPVGDYVSHFYESGLLEKTKREVEVSDWIAPGGSQGKPHKYVAVEEFDSEEKVPKNKSEVEKILNQQSGMKGKFYFGILHGIDYLIYAEQIEEV